MAQTLRLAALAAASTVAIVAGSALSMAQEKERIGIDNVDKCEATLFDPNCNNDAMEGNGQDFSHGFEVKQFGSIEDEANAERRRTDFLDEDGIADSE